MADDDEQDTRDTADTADTPAEREARITASLYRRPHYAWQDRVRIVMPGPFCEQVATVEDVQPFQTVSGQLLGYFYRVRLPNYVTLTLAEDDLAPLVAPTT